MIVKENVHFIGADYATQKAMRETTTFVNIFVLQIGAVSGECSEAEHSGDAARGRG